MKNNLLPKVLLILAMFLTLDVRCLAGQFNLHTQNSYNYNRNNPGYVELLVDYSSSMGYWVKIMVTCLEDILPMVHPRTSFAFRTFGGSFYGNYNSGQEKSCMETRLFNGFGVDGNAAILNNARTFKPSGMTPLTLALKETIEKDMARQGSSSKKKIILLTDGGETCGGDPCAYIKHIAKTRKDVEIDVILFGGHSGLMCLTEPTGGKYYTVSSPQSYASALESALNVPAGTVKQIPRSNTNQQSPQNRNYQRPNRTQQPNRNYQQPPNTKTAPSPNRPQPPKAPITKGYKFINY